MATKKTSNLQEKNKRKSPISQLEQANANRSVTPAKGELNRGSGVKPANRGMTPAETQRYQALIYAARTPSKGETNRNRENRLEPIKSVSKPSAPAKSNLQPIKTMTAEDRKRRLDPIKSKRK